MRGVLLLLLGPWLLACERPFDPNPFSVDDVFSSRDGTRLYTTGTFTANDEHRATQSGAAAALFLVNPATGKPTLDRAYELGELRLRAVLGEVIVASGGANLVLLERDSFLPDRKTVATLPLGDSELALAGLALAVVKPLDDRQALVSLVRTGTDDAVKGRTLLLSIPSSGPPVLAPAPSPLDETGCTTIVQHPPFLSCFASASVPLAEGGTQLMGKLVVMKDGGGSFSQMTHAHTEVGDPAAPFDGPRATAHFLFPWGGVATDDGRVRVIENSGGIVTFTVGADGQLTYQRSDLANQGTQALLSLGGGRSLVLSGSGVGLFDDQPGPAMTEVARRTSAASTNETKAVTCAPLSGIAMRSIDGIRVAVAAGSAGLLLLEVGKAVEVRGGSFRRWLIRTGLFQPDTELTGEYLDDRDPQAAGCLDP